MSSSNTTKGKERDDAAWKSANEINEAMLGVQSYADDSMFFMIRYGHKVQLSLRAKDYTDFIGSMRGLMQLWTKPAEAAGGAAERSKKAAELREHAKSLVQGFPELESDFDRYVTASRSTMRAFHGDQL